MGSSSPSVPDCPLRIAKPALMISACLLGVACNHRGEVSPAAVVDKQPAIGEVTDEKRFVIRACEVKPVVFRPPNGPWRIEVLISPTFVPAELDTTLSDRRELGAVVAFDVVPLEGGAS